MVYFIVCCRGLAGVTGDYIHGNTAPKIVKPLVILASTAAFAGLIYLNYHDVGFGQAVRMLYTANL